MPNEGQDHSRQNTEERRRLAALGASLTASQWSGRLANGWTVAALFGHLGFWDRVTLALIERYEREGVVPVKSDFHTLNAVLAALFERMSPEQCFAWAVEAAEALDARIEALAPVLVAEIIEKDGVRRIHRHIHRRNHLDQVEQLLRRA
jgi:Mycothiol maleylpyruvate isomerase N-terminal domain